MKQVVSIHSIDNGSYMAIHLPPKSSKSSTSRGFWKVKERPFPVNNFSKTEVKVGDMVKIEMEPAEVISGSFKLFIIPLIAFLVIYLSLFMVHEAIRIAASFAGMGFGFYIPVLLRKRGRVEKLPEIIGIATPEDIKCMGGCGSCSLCG